MKSVVTLILMTIFTTSITARPTFDKIAEAILDVVAENPYTRYPPESGGYHEHYHNDHYYYGNGGQPNGYYQQPSRGQPNGYYQQPSRGQPNGYYQQPNGGYPDYPSNYRPSQPSTYVQGPPYPQRPDSQYIYTQEPYAQGNYGGGNGYTRHRGYKTHGY